MCLALRAAHLAAVTRSPASPLEGEPVTLVVRAEQVRPFCGVSERLYDIDPKLFRGVAHEQPSAQRRQVNRARSMWEAPFDVSTVSGQANAGGSTESRHLSDILKRRSLGEMEQEPGSEYGYSYWYKGKLVCWKTELLFAGFDETAEIEEEENEE